MKNIAILVFMLALPFNAFAEDGRIIDRSVSLLEKMYETGKGEFEKSGEFNDRMAIAKKRLIDKINSMANEWELDVELTRYDADSEIYYFNIIDNEATAESTSIRFDERVFGVSRDEAKTLKGKTLKAKVQFRILHKFHGCYAIIDEEEETCDHDVILIQHGGVVRDVESGKEYRFK